MFADSDTGITWKQVFESFVPFKGIKWVVWSYIKNELTACKKIMKMEYIMLALCMQDSNGG
jgi:hypothetical protein